MSLLARSQTSPKHTMSLPTGRRKGTCALWIKRNWVLLSLVGLAVAAAALSVLLCTVHKSNVAALLRPRLNDDINAIDLLDGVAVRFADRAP